MEAIRQAEEEANLVAVGDSPVAVGAVVQRGGEVVVHRTLPPVLRRFTRLVVGEAHHLPAELVLQFTLRVVAEPRTFRGVAVNRR